MRLKGHAKELTSCILEIWGQTGGGTGDKHSNGD